jgi:hypothetical protein
VLTELRQCCIVVLEMSNRRKDDNQDLISSSELAELLLRPVRQVQRMAREGKLPYVRKLPGPTGAYLFSRAHLTGQETGDTASEDSRQPS